MQHLPSIEERLASFEWKKRADGKYERSGSGMVAAQEAIDGLPTMGLLIEMQSRHDEAEAEVLLMQVQLGELRKERDRINEVAEKHGGMIMKFAGYLDMIAGTVGLLGGKPYEDLSSKIAVKLVDKCKECDDRPLDRDNLKLRNTIEALEGVLVMIARGDDQSVARKYAVQSDSGLRVEALEAAVKEQAELYDSDTKSIELIHGVLGNLAFGHGHSVKTVIDDLLERTGETACRLTEIKAELVLRLEKIEKRDEQLKDNHRATYKRLHDLEMIAERIGNVNEDIDDIREVAVQRNDAIRGRLDHIEQRLSVSGRPLPESDQPPPENDQS